MKLKLLSLISGIVISSIALNASAQKAYKEGSVTYTATVMGTTVDSKMYFKGDSSSTSGKQGPASFKTITAKNGEYLVILIDVPIANMKKAAIATPAELEEAKDAEPTFTFTPGTETKVINGFNCKKVMAKDDKTGQSYEAWVTNDFTLPSNSLTRFFSGAGGFPIQFTTMQMGQAININIKSITEEKVPAGTFSVPADYDKITLTDLKNMRGGGR